MLAVFGGLVAFVGAAVLAVFVIVFLASAYERR